jgi:guanylate kinase
MLIESSLSSSKTTERTGRLILFTGPSGVGKNKILTALFEHHSHQLNYSISTTTRTPRVGEVAGKDYDFVSKEAFEALIAQDGFLEYAQYNGQYYGTPKAKINEWLAKGVDVVLEIETQGALQLMAKIPASSLFSVFILPPPPAIETLRARLKTRNTETAEQIEARLGQAEREMLEAPKFQHQLVNVIVADTAKALSQLLYGTSS